MSDTNLWPEIGLQEPSTGFTPGGRTIIRLLNTTSGKAFTAGESVRLVSTYTDAATASAGDSFLGFTDMASCIAPTADDATADQAQACTGICLEDIADDASGLVLVRGMVYADVDGDGTNIVSDMGLYHGGETSVDHLSPVDDAAANESIKIVAYSRNTTSITTTGAKCWVLYNGIEGFGHRDGV
tara:strand:+ start:3134 stop:3688 length:555 start_codon:yes stop_codon:yes gene_type:complete